MQLKKQQQQQKITLFLSFKKENTMKPSEIESQRLEINTF